MHAGTYYLVHIFTKNGPHVNSIVFKPRSFENLFLINIIILYLLYTTLPTVYNPRFDWLSTVAYK
jgi:hypothetical protein